MLTWGALEGDNDNQKDMVYHTTKICNANQDIQTIASSPHLPFTRERRPLDMGRPRNRESQHGLWKKRKLSRRMEGTGARLVLLGTSMIYEGSS